MTQINSSVEPFVAVSSHFFSEAPSLNESDKRRLCSYDRETMLHLRQFSFHLPKLPLPVLPCTIPEEFARGIEEGKTTAFRSTIPAGTNPRVSTNGRNVDSGRRGLKESLGGSFPSPVSVSPQIQSPLIPEGYVSAKMINRAAALMSSRSDLTNSKGEIIQPHLETPPAISSPLLVQQNDVVSRTSAPPGFDNISSPHVTNLMDKMTLGGEKKVVVNRGEIDRSEMSPMYDNRNRLKTSQDSIPLRSSLESLPEDSSLYQRLRSLPTASPVSNSPAFPPRRTVLSSSSSAYNHSNNNSPMLSPATGSPLTNRYAPLPSTLLSSSTDGHSPVNYSSEIPARHGYSIPVGRDADVFSPKVYANVRRSNSALSPSIHSSHSFSSSNGHEMLPNRNMDSTSHLFSSAPPYAPDHQRQVAPLTNGTESTSFITSLLPIGSHDPRQGHMSYQSNMGQGTAPNAPYYPNSGLDKWFGQSHLQNAPPAMMHNPNLP
eukprot:TRINITY_DN421_c0_g1_i1.p1 TRINITY_DN421_c0_g1~~TRINITY_DN421_c0_g1_i1.p1  ORF type:complete len:488 (-),score=121.75 TRINITY_DN421_c0_g1_i1:40-1503(-)